MNKFFRYGLMAIGVGLFISAVSVSEARSQGIMKDILRRMDNYNKTLQSLKCDVTMVKYNPQLNVSDTTIGSTSYLPKTANPKKINYVRIDWTKPTEEQISVIGDNYELYRPRLNQVIVGSTSKAKNSASVGGALGFMNMSQDQLKANYSPVYIGEEQISGGTQTWHIQLTPKTATSYKLADLWVDGDGIPRQAKITEQNDDTTTVLLTNIRRNESIQGSIFKLNYPGNVKRIKA